MQQRMAFQCRSKSGARQALDSAVAAVVWCPLALHPCTWAFHDCNEKDDRRQGHMAAAACCAHSHTCVTLPWSCTADAHSTPVHV